MHDDKTSNEAKEPTLQKPGPPIPQNLQRLSRWMDSSIPLPGGYRIGWDSIIGLIPGFGDVAGLGISLYIVAGAYRAGASVPTLLRMLFNVLLETILGAVPLVGDLFDMAFKANIRNMRLLERQSEHPDSLDKQSGQRLWLLVLGIVLAIVIAVYAMFTLLSVMVRFLF